MGVLAEEKRETTQLDSLDEMTLYLRDIRSFPLLDEQEERSLTLRCAQGDSDAIRLLVCSNLRLVVNIARDYAGNGVPLMDLVQEGSIGLLSAAKRFDPTLGFRFSTYATKWIRRGVLRCLNGYGTMIHVPAHILEKIHKVLRVKAEMTNSNGQEPTLEQLSESLEMESDQVCQLLLLIPQLQSFDDANQLDCGLQDVFEDNLNSPPQEQMVRDELVRVMECLLSRLTNRQRLILRLHFGMEDGECYSLESISRRLSISKERVRQIKQQAMERLKKSGAAFGLEDFLNE